MTQPTPTTLRQRVLDYIGASPRTRADLVNHFGSPSVMNTVGDLVCKGELRSSSGSGRRAQYTLAATSRGGDLVAAWRAPQATHGSAP